MGGLVIQDPRLPFKYTVLGPQFVILLAQSGKFVRIPKWKISDKSRANVFQKVLVVTQVSWMVMQCIVRKAYGLPLSLLEIHTMVHVVCAFILLGFWFRVS